MGKTLRERPEENIIRSKGSGDTFFNTFIGQLIKAKSIFKKRYIDVDSEQLYVGVPSDVWASLFALEKATSKDYINTATLQAGKIESFAGFWFVDIEKVPGDDSFPIGTQFPGLTDPKYTVKLNDRGVREQTKGSSAKFENDIKYVLPVWCKSAVVFSQRKNITTEHSKDPSKWHAPQLTVTASFGATRVEPEKILGIEISASSLSVLPSQSELKPAKKEDKKVA